MEASETADRAFQVPPPTCHHTIRDADDDIQLMMHNLLESGAVEERNRTGPPFEDPSTIGMESKASKGWIESILHAQGDHDQDGQEMDI